MTRSQLSIIPRTVLALLALLCAHTQPCSGQGATPAVEMRVFNGFDLIEVEVPYSATENGLKFLEPLPEAYYLLKFDTLYSSGSFYSDGRSLLSVRVNAKDAVNRLEFEDPTNQVLANLNREKLALELRSAQAMNSFNPAAIDSFYMTKFMERARLLKTAQQAFNRNVDSLRSAHPSVVALQLLAPLFKTSVFEDDRVHGRYYDNQQAYLRDHFFEHWKLVDPAVIKHPILQQRVEEYFNLYCMQEYEFTVAKCSEIMGLSQNAEIRNYLATVMIRFFETVHEARIVAYIKEELLGGDLSGIDKDDLDVSAMNRKGMVVTPLVLPNEKGEETDLRTVYEHSAHTLLYFWMPDCGHCEALLPVVREARQRFKNLSTYGVGITDDVEAWKAALETFQMHDVNVIASNAQREETVLAFGFNRTPFVLLLDKKGRIVEKAIETEALLETISKYE